MKNLLKVILILALLTSFTLTAEPKHGIAVHENIKYTPQDTHLSYANPEAPKGGLLKLGEVGKIDSLNPMILKGDSTPNLLGRVYATLMKRSRDEAFSLYGYVAESVELPEDRSYILFNLRKNARFEDHTPITADDVVFTFNLIKEKGHPSFKMNYNRAIKIEKLSDHSVKIYFDPQSNDKERPYILCLMPILSKKYYEKIDFESSTLVQPLSSGPYRVKHFEPGKKLELERVKDFWGENLFCEKGLNNFDNISITYFRDEHVLFENFKNQGFDFFHETDYARWNKEYPLPALSQGKLKKVEIKHQRPFGMFGIALNLRRPLFQDQRVRKALIMLMNQDQINKDYYGSYYQPNISFFGNCELQATGAASTTETDILGQFKHYVPDACYAEIKHEELSPRERMHNALAMLKEAGWTSQGTQLVKDGKPFEFELILGEKPHEKIALAYADMLKKVGIKLSVRFIDSTQFNARKDKYEFDAVIHLWGVSLSPGAEQNMYWSSLAADRPGTRNYPGIKSPLIDSLIDKMLTQKSRADYLYYVKALDRALWAQDAIVPLVYWNKDLLAYWDKFERPTLTNTCAKELVYLSQVDWVMETWWQKK